jgi:hypothetical protein
MKSTYTAYDSTGSTVKSGVVAYEAGTTEDETAMNFAEAVVHDVGEELFEEYVAGIRP